jgi:hypothetical protein
MKNDDIKVTRTGEDPQSFMITEDIIGCVEPGKYYKATLKGLSHTDKETGLVVNSHSKEAIKYKAITGKWLPAKKNEYSNANLLGGFGTLEIDESTLEIPEVLATDQSLAFYGAKLIKINDVFQFETNEELPVTIMNIGKNYVQGYLKLPHLGGGTYIEHHDKPHFHLPIESSCSGHMIIGDVKNEVYRLSAFKIPYGFGIYTPPNLLHADAYLIGRYIVVYSVTDDYSTVLFKTKNRKLVDVNIQKN